MDVNLTQAQLTDVRVFSRYKYLITQFGVTLTYIRLLFFPVNQHTLYQSERRQSLLEPGVYLPFIFLAALFFGAVYLLYRSKRNVNPYGITVSFGVLWFFITLSVESSIIPIQHTLFEHRLYLPSVGFFLSFVAVLIYASSLIKKNFGKFSYWNIWILITVIAAVLSVATHMRNRHWSDDILFYENELKYEDLYMTHYNLANTYRDRGELDMAISEYKKVNSLYQVRHNSWSHNNLGAIFASKGRYEEARWEFQTALTIDPGNEDAVKNLKRIEETVKR
ncbi:MAG: tetratricopeptide repeat protein [Deltaproteobacteria bacterium]|nr:tetratricopeptide repeat protein [Deltaproteobacteria bacterium]